MENEKKNEQNDSTDLIGKLENLDGRIIYLMVCLVIIIILLNPGLMKPSGGIRPKVQSYYDAIQALEPGDKVVVTVACTYAGLFRESGSAHIATINELFAQKADVVFISFFDYAMPVLNEEIVPKRIDNDIMQGMEYGENYAVLGYITGSESGVASFVQDLRGTTPYDWFGNNIDDLPVMDGIDSYSDFDLSIVLGFFDWHIRQFWTGDPDVPILGQVSDQNVAPSQPYITSGQILGWLPGVVGAQEYEVITNRPGLAIAVGGAQKAMLYMALVFIIVGNILGQIRKNTEVKR